MISIHAPRTGSDHIYPATWPEHDISIHAPRTGSDFYVVVAFKNVLYFNPRSPHGERRDASRRDDRILHTFQSTLPARGATGTTSTKHTARIFQSTLPARGATNLMPTLSTETSYFNPRSPHGERHALNDYRRTFAGYFNPRSPHGERRANLQGYNFNRRISIHAPRTGSDALGFRIPYTYPYFNPRSPHGERRCRIPGIPCRALISIHAPRTGSDGP